MYPVILTVHIVVSVLLVLIVMIQSGRSGGFSNIMGGGGGDALFSTSGQQSGLRKATIILAVTFMATSLGLTLVSNRQSVQSVFQKQFPNLPPVSSSSSDSGKAQENLPVPGSKSTDFKTSQMPVKSNSASTEKGPVKK